MEQLPRKGVEARPGRYQRIGIMPGGDDGVVGAELAPRGEDAPPGLLRIHSDGLRLELHAKP